MRRSACFLADGGGDRFGVCQLFVFHLVAAKIACLRSICANKSAQAHRPITLGSRVGGMLVGAAFGGQGIRPAGGEQRRRTTAISLHVKMDIYAPRRPGWFVQYVHGGAGDLAKGSNFCLHVALNVPPDTYKARPSVGTSTGLMDEPFALQYVVGGRGILDSPRACACGEMGHERRDEHLHLSTAEACMISCGLVILDVFTGCR